MTNFFSMPYLPGHLEDEFIVQSSRNSLPPIYSQFFVPRMEEKPQNPIMDTLKRYRPPSFAHLPPEIIEMTQDLVDPAIHIPKVESIDSIWAEALTRKTGVRSQVLSWDNLHPMKSKAVSSTPFLSEQNSNVFASVRHHLQPRLHDPNTDVLHITPHVLWQNLKVTICGASSQLHTWDTRTERFVQVGLKDGRKGRILVDGKDGTISSSVLRPFLRIGNMVRRLETLLTVLRSRAAKEGPTIHAFAHALSTTLTFLRDSLTCSPLAQASNVDILSTKFTTHYVRYDNILVSLADMCGVGDDRQPSSYQVLESQPQPLLSRIYDHLHMHIERQSDKSVVAVIAYLLTNTSHEYFVHVSRSVGFGGHPLPKATHVVGENPNLYEEDEVKQDNIFDLIESAEEDQFPSFFPENLIEALPAARKSLILLRAAQPDHELLITHLEQKDIRWFWEEEEIMNEQAQQPSSSVVIPRQVAEEDRSGDDNPFAQFKVFDLEPGVHIGTSCFDHAFTASSTDHLQAFIDAFPSKLPLITPTLSHLTDLVFRPLLTHAAMLSSALISLFLSPSTHLNLHAHMALLQSYLLFSSPDFKARINVALFSDHEDTDYDEQTRNPLSLYALRRRRAREQDPNTVWAVGLAASLLDRDAWPPVGADLSFFLRTVIVDTFEAAVGNKMDGQAKQGASEDLDSRLGFAIRDLPVGRGRDRWLSPLSIEALDFLYMDYKPPHPLEVLITPEILAKYQRIFTFLLRLTRVENAIAAVHRMTRPSDTTVFPTLSPSRTLLLHLKFITQSLVSSLSQYTFVTAIGGNFDVFLLRLSLTAPPLLWDSRPSGFTDVFELAKAHSELLDDILSACLMRSTQRAASDMLRDVLQLVLDFAVLVGRLKRQQLEEYEAAPLLESLYWKFRLKMAELVKTLRAMVDKNGRTSYIRRPPGGTEALSHLLTRWDISDWWISPPQRRDGQVDL
ncbi:gamma-tubulin complex, DGRIP91/SPC98 component protein [Hymenopellis radicata]|nr:gamma-tubulin complex, DGRIP91/SPC98 component protein [Hymenopellis radicata]